MSGQCRFGAITNSITCPPPRSSLSPPFTACCLKSLQHDTDANTDAVVEFDRGLCSMLDMHTYAYMHFDFLAMHICRCKQTWANQANRIKSLPRLDTITQHTRVPRVTSLLYHHAVNTGHAASSCPPVCETSQEVEGHLAGHHRGLRVQVQHSWHKVAVVGLGVRNLLAQCRAERQGVCALYTLYTKHA